MYSNKDIKKLIKEMEKINNKLNYLIEITNSPLHINYNDIPSPCKNCLTHPANGGNGICNCTLGTQIIY